MKLLAFLLGGVLFGYGLAYSHMAQPEVVLSFLQLTDFGLLLVLLAAIIVMSVTYVVAPKLMKKPVWNRFSKKSEPVSSGTIYGAILFGIGWGLSGLCPGSAIASLGIGNLPVLWGLAGMFLGAFTYGSLKEYSRNF